MNKSELVERMSKNKNAGIESKAEARRVVDAILEEIAYGIKKDGQVALGNFGILKVTRVENSLGKLVKSLVLKPGKIVESSIKRAKIKK